MKELRIVLATPGPDTALMMADMYKEGKYGDNDVTLEFVMMVSEDTFNPYLNGMINENFIDGMRKFCADEIVVVEHDCTKFIDDGDDESYDYAKDVAIKAFAEMLVNQDDEMLDIVDYDVLNICIANFEEDHDNCEKLYKAIFTCDLVRRIDDVEFCMEDRTRISGTNEILTDFPGLFGCCIDQNYYSDYARDVLFGICDAIRGQEEQEDKDRIIKEVVDNNLINCDAYTDIAFVVNCITAFRKNS